MSSSHSSDSEFEDAREEISAPQPEQAAPLQAPRHQQQPAPNANANVNPAVQIERVEGLNAQDIVRQVIDNLWPVLGDNNNLEEEDVDDDGMENVQDGYFDEEEYGQNESDENSPLVNPNEEGNEEQGPAEFDHQLPARHAYLGGAMEELQGRVVFADGGPTPEIPLLLMGVLLVPGQTLPLSIFHPVFQNAIRRCIMTNRVFGIVYNEVEIPTGSVVFNGAFGTIAEIYEYQEDNDERHQFGMPTFALKAKGRQRFNVVSFRRQADGNLLGVVRIRPEVRLLPLVQSLLLDNTHRFRFPVEKRKAVDAGFEATEPSSATATQAPIPVRKLSKTQSISSQSEDGGGDDSAAVDAELAQMRREILEKRKITKFYSAFTTFPYFVYEQYDELVLVERIHRKLRVELKGLTQSTHIPKDANELSFWVAQNLTMDDQHRINLLKMDSPVQRLRYELDLLSRACKVLTCRFCQTTIAESGEIFSMSVEGPQGTYVNPHGVVHETLTVHKTSNVMLRGQSSTEASWFPGYSWTIAECKRCSCHLGWKFKAVERLKPQKFWGLARKSISFKYNFLTDEEAADARESNSNPRERTVSS